VTTTLFIGEYIMDINIAKMIDNSDGSATLHIDLDEEAMKVMATYGVYQALVNIASLMKIENDDEEVK
jgi:methylaspartate ammonia-lyase